MRCAECGAELPGDCVSPKLGVTSRENIVHILLLPTVSEKLRSCTQSGKQAGAPNR